MRKPIKASRRRPVTSFVFLCFGCALMPPRAALTCGWYGGLTDITRLYPTDT